MPKQRIDKYYAVLNGRGGPNIYLSRDEFQAATHNFSGSSARSFLTYEDAREWLDDSGILQVEVRHRDQGTSMPNESPDLSRKPRRCVRLASSSLQLSRYPNSSKFWIDNRPYIDDHVDVGIQCPDTVTVQPMTATTHQQYQATTGQPTLNEGSTQTQEVASHPANSAAIHLSSEQKDVLEQVRSGRNVFFTGPAGTGKSVLLREIIIQLRTKVSVAVTAPTGIAGLNIGGSTIHSFAGIGLGKEPKERLAENILRSKRLYERWTSTKVLIIDEVSMLDAILFDKLEYIARYVRNCPRPFGGIQLVICGDFFQLPPVPDQSHNYRMPASYAFDAQSWPECISRPIFLTQVFRQKDNAFVNILSSMRTGVLTSSHITMLKQLVRPLHYADGIAATELYPLKRDVEACNNHRLRALMGPERTYCAVDSAGYDVQHRPISAGSANQLLDRMIAVPKITLKIGAQVMLIQNFEQGCLVNGSVGKVMEFITTREAVDRHISIAIPKSTSNGQSQQPPKPLQPGYLDFDPLPSSDLRPINNNTFTQKEQWPLVRFTNDRELLCAPLSFSVEGFMGNIEAHRFQVPLILAWALSIHKSQGQTLARLKVDLGHIFEKGQAYVALSRATNLENLEIQNFQPSKVMAHPRVLEWQKFWTRDIPQVIQNTAPDEMDSEEAISRFWGSAPLPR